ncbi:unnamed protein product, partial [Rotaria socialis]
HFSTINAYLKAVGLSEIHCSKLPSGDKLSFD